MSSIPDTEFQPLAEELRRVSSRRPLCYLANPGTWGAALTREATHCFLRAIGVPFEEISGITPWELLRGRFRGAALLYGGGGAWSPEFPGGRDLVGRALLGFPTVVVLPSTLGLPVPWPRCQVWARDRFHSLRQVPRARFCHDLGLFPRDMPEIVPTETRGVFFRNDVLSSQTVGVSGGSQPADLSSQGTERSAERPFLEAIGRFREVHTDRVHVAIAACLLGRDCHVYPTQSPLLGDLFASSLGPYFPRAVWHAKPFRS